MLLECQNCGGPLDAKPNARIVRCTYCGHDSRVASLRTMAQETPAGWKPPPVWTPPAQFPAPSVPIQYHSPNRAPLVIAALVGVLALGASGAAMILLNDASSAQVRFGGDGTPTVVVGPGAPPATTAAAKDEWDGKSTLRCALGRELVVENKRATIDGTVIDAAMNCRVLVKNSRLKGRTVIAGAMTANIRIENSTLEAEHAAVDCAMACEVTVEKNSRLVSKDTGVSLAQAGKLRLKDSTIDAEGTAVQAASASTVRIESSTISGKQAAIDFDSPGELDLDRATLRGKRKIDKGVRVTER